MNIFMEPEQVREVANEFDHLNDKFSSSFTVLSYMVNATPWQGPSRETFINDFKALCLKANELIASGHRIAHSVFHEVDEWESVDNEGKGRIKRDYENFIQSPEPPVDRYAQLRKVYEFIENLREFDLKLQLICIQMLTNEEVMKSLLDTGLTVLGFFGKGPFMPFTPGFDINPNLLIVKPEDYGFLIIENNQYFLLNSQGKNLVA